MTLHSVLYNLVNTNTLTTITSYTIYRGFYNINFKRVGKGISSSQKHLEKLRPKIDYIQLVDSSVLVGFASDYDTLKQAVLELNMQILLDIKKKELQIMRQLADFTRVYKNSKPYHETYPEEFI